MSILKGIGAVLKGVLMAKVPDVIRPGYHVGDRVQYIDTTVTPAHYGIIVGTWNERVKVVFDGFELGTWVDNETIRRYAQ